MLQAWGVLAPPEAPRYSQGPGTHMGGERYQGAWLASSASVPLLVPTSPFFWGGVQRLLFTLGEMSL